MGHELQPVQMPGPTYHKSQMSHPDQIHTSWHCLRISPLRQISGRYNLRKPFLDPPPTLIQSPRKQTKR